VQTLTFSHPDFTVGSGISPDHAEKYFLPLAGFTAGREFHPAPKVVNEIVSIHNYNDILSCGQCPEHASSLKPEHLVLFSLNSLS
jgi:hypothetical protein